MVSLRVKVWVTYIVFLSNGTFRSKSRGSPATWAVFESEWYKRVLIILFSLVLVMQKDLGKIKKHSSDLFLQKHQTKPADVKLLKDVEVSFEFLMLCISVAFV